MPDNPYKVHIQSLLEFVKDERGMASRQPGYQSDQTAIAVALAGVAIAERLEAIEERLRRIQEDQAVFNMDKI